MKKGIITLSVPKGTTDSDIQAIRDRYKQEGYRVNVVVSGKDNFTDTLIDMLKTRLKYT